MNSKELVIFGQKEIEERLEYEGSSCSSEEYKDVMNTFLCLKGSLKSVEHHSLFTINLIQLKQ